ncbi:MAG: type II toxin-antitoxin system RelE/ParE family toxin [Dehalococcoidia bacterium]|nr:type II toxin-antitoxin system RelE/ParE family toxin [Dehalococcoidia bacterium]
MERYDLLIKPSVARDLRGIPREDVPGILQRIHDLPADPRPPGVEKLSAQERYRVRQGDYRIIYSVDDRAHLVEVVQVGHRRDVYRR